MTTPLTERIALLKQELDAHINIKPSKAEAKDWAKKFNKLSNQLDALRASDPNRKVRIADEPEEDEDENA
jgi:hypothetical protein